MKEFNRGWYFPVALVLLFEDGTLTSEDLVLLGIINAYQDPEMEGCWASNAHLAKRLNKSPRAVCRRIHHYIDLGLLRSRMRRDGLRVLRVTFAGDNYEGPSTDRDPTSKLATPWSKVARTPGQKCPPTTTREQAHKPPGGGRSDLVFENSCFPDTQAGKLCYHFERFFKRHRLHWVINGQGKKVEVKINRHNWLRAVSTLLNDTSATTIKEVMDWFFEHHRDDFVPRCGSVITFCQKYKQVRQSMGRSTGTPVEDDEETNRLVAEADRLAAPYRNRR